LEEKQQVFVGRMIGVLQIRARMVSIRALLSPATQNTNNGDPTATALSTINSSDHADSCRPLLSNRNALRLHGGPLLKIPPS